MQIVVKYKSGGIQFTELPHRVGTGISRFDATSDVSAEESSLDYMPPSSLIFWQAEDGCFYAARRTMRDRNKPVADRRATVNSVQSFGGYGNPCVPYLILTYSELADVEFIEVDGIRVWNNAEGYQSKTEKTSPCKQARLDNDSLMRRAEATGGKLRESKGMQFR